MSDVLSSDVKNAAKRNDLIQGEVEKMLKDTYEELKKEKPTELRNLGIDKIAVVKGQKNMMLFWWIWRKKR